MTDFLKTDNLRIGFFLFGDQYVLFRSFEATLEQSSIKIVGKVFGEIEILCFFLHSNFELWEEMSRGRVKIYPAYQIWLNPIHDNGL